MGALTIVTNHVPRDLMNWWELTDREKKDFDYLKTEQEREDAEFFRYKGHVYCMDEFVRPGTPWMSRMPDEFKGWDGYASDSFFSGVLIKFVDEFERVIVGRYYS